ncbi:hypothetical protein BS78_05G131900 [Paspalum vaginatum]|nr:hypothetical protein BS78_05G131900 [Paspalum vaginatum]
MGRPPQLASASSPARRSPCPWAWPRRRVRVEQWRRRAPTQRREMLGGGDQRACTGQRARGRRAPWTAPPHGEQRERGARCVRADNATAASPPSNEGRMDIYRNTSPLRPSEANRIQRKLMERRVQNWKIGSVVFEASQIFHRHIEKFAIF